MGEFPFGFSNFVSFLQLTLAVITGLYLWNLLRGQQTPRTVVEKDSRREMEKLQRLRSISLSEPLAEKTRPASFGEIVGQEEGLKSLKAALCGPNPQHVIIYGPPGVGKTAAARLVLEEAKKNRLSPFKEDAVFVEIDATTARFDERGIADPLIGSVHDPIYQGAGPLGMAGVPQPKPGAVTRAHGGVLFIDEIGELHPIQMNKLLKVMEDRRVFLDSAYYNPEDTNIPSHIRDIFENGLPADFRLVGATTREPEHIPPALRSRCVEIFFRQLTPEEIEVIAANAAKKIGLPLEKKALEVVKKFATNGREAVNIVQLAGSLAITEGRKEIRTADAEWVVNCGRYAPRPEKKVSGVPQTGLANGLAVLSSGTGMLVEVEASAVPAAGPRGVLTVTGLVEEEEIGGGARTVRRKSMARSSVDNVFTALARVTGYDPRRYDVHINFPGGFPADGPSAGVTIAVAVYSAMVGFPVDNLVAMTGEVSIRGLIAPVGGIVAKVEAARQAGAQKVIIPAENYQQIFANCAGIEIIPVKNLKEVLELAVMAPHFSGQTAAPAGAAACDA